MANMTAKKIYHGEDPRYLPAYEVSEAARYLGLPYYTLYSWVRPVEFVTKDPYCTKSLIQRPRNSTKLSFMNLVEGHIIKAINQHHRVPVPEILSAVEYAKNELGIEDLLVNKELKVGVKQLFVQKFDQLVSLGRGGQLAMQKVLSRYLERVEYNEHLPVRFFPLVQDSKHKYVSISPTVSFGKPIVGGIKTRVIAERYEIGDEKTEIADDYGLSEDQVEEAIIYEAAA